MSAKPFIPRVPDATICNRMEYAGAYRFAYGGTYENAVAVWRVECLANAKRDLSRPFPVAELRKTGVLE